MVFYGLFNCFVLLVRVNKGIPFLLLLFRLLLHACPFYRWVLKSLNSGLCWWHLVSLHVKYLIREQLFNCWEIQLFTLVPNSTTQICDPAFSSCNSCVLFLSSTFCFIYFLIWNWIFLVLFETKNSYLPVLFLYLGCQRQEDWKN